MSIQIGLAQLQLDNDAIARFTNSALDDQSRFTTEAAQIDLWGKKREQLPDSAIPVLVHQIFFQIEWFDQISWFNRTEERDELWVFTDVFTNVQARLLALKPLKRADALLAFGQKVTPTISVPRSGSFDESLLALLSAFLSTPAGAVAGMERITATAYINKAHLRVILECIESYRERKRLQSEEYMRQARGNETEIVRVARELGLDPVPSGDSPTAWIARCPGQRGRYTLWLSAKSDQFGCPYCRVRGGIDELRVFLAKEDGHEHLA
ncbi:hypothetical protein GWP57_12835 [Gammaproteobacteria bacterium]|nr:hypothetical protein [Gammaproteobacteria bacterium]